MPSMQPRRGGCGFCSRALFTVGVGICAALGFNFPCLPYFSSFSRCTVASVLGGRLRVNDGAEFAGCAMRLEFKTTSFHTR